MFNQLGDPFLFWVLRLVVLLSLFYSGYLITYKDKNETHYWKYSSIGIIVYSLVEGLRWDRGVDYMHYYQDITGNLYTNYSEIVYVWWTEFFKFTDLPYWTAFIFYSFLLIHGFYFLLKRFKKQAVWALPLFFIVTVASSENLIRQYLAVSMFEYALYFFLEKKYFKSVIFALLTIQTHNAVIILIAGALLVHYIHFDKTIKNGYLLIVIYLCFYYFWDPAFLSPLTTWLSSLNVGDASSMSSYLEDASFWFSDESSLSERLGYVSRVASFAATAVSLVTTCLIIKYGFDLTKKESCYRIFYWFSYLSYILYIFSNNGDFEMWSRLSVMFRFVSSIVIAGMITSLTLKKMERYMIYAFCGVYFLYNSFFSMWGQSIFGCAFIWDR